MPEEPVIVSGGSTCIKFRRSFDIQPDADPEWWYCKNDSARMARVLINGQEVAQLTDKDVVEIIYNTDATGGV